MIRIHLMSAEDRAQAILAIESAKTGLVVEIKQYRRDRTPPQNRMIHKLLGAIGAYSGHSIGELKDHFYPELGYTEVRLDPTGAPREYRMSTIDLSLEQCNELITTLVAFAAEHQIPTTSEERYDH